MKTKSSSPNLNIRDLVTQHFNWLSDVGWTNKSPLEELALVASEVGEAVNECRGETPTDHLPSELADIVLRVAGLAGKLDIDLEQAIVDKMALNIQRGTRGRLK